MKAKAIPACAVPWEATTVDLATGKIASSSISWQRLGPALEGTCPICAVRHDPEFPHEPASPFYMAGFEAMIGRMPTWADASAHCTADLRRFWRVRIGDLWTVPPKGERPVAHHGIFEPQSEPA